MKYEVYSKSLEDSVWYCVIYYDLTGTPTRISAIMAGKPLFSYFTVLTASVYDTITTHYTLIAKVKSEQEFYKLYPEFVL